MTNSTGPLSPQDLARFKDQLIIVLIKRLASAEGTLTIPVSEVDDTGMDLLDMEVNQETREFTFKLSKKS